VDTLTIHGFTIIAFFTTAARPTEIPGRIIFVDRGKEWVERYVVAWQGMGISEWASRCEQSVYCRDLAIARMMFVARVQKEVL
jgi:hypothetical protein